MRGFILDLYKHSRNLFYLVCFLVFYILKTKKKLLRRELYPEND